MKPSTFYNILICVLYGCFLCIDALRSCSSNQYLCKEDNLCVPKSWRCDTVRQCSLGSDEFFCREFHINRNSNRTLRLVGGNTRKEGRLEIKYANIWGTICSDRFDINSADVACRELGFSGAVSVKNFGPGSGQIWLDEVRCHGNETNLMECKRNSLAAHDCTHKQDVGVVCKECSDQIIKMKETRIISGREAVPGSWPWMASIQVRFLENKWYHFCGGTLIDRQWLLTAAHCFDGSKDPKHYRIVIGKHNISKVEATEQIINISQIYVRQDYVVEQHPNDIALIKLATPAKLNSPYVNTVCLPSAAEPSLSSRDYCYVAGWGKTRESDSSDVLQQARMPLIDTVKCQLFYTGVTKKMVCGGYLYGGTDSCKGDSGGPLICRRQGKWKLGGVISWGVGCAQPLKPGVYTRVKPYLSWIQNVTDLSMDDVFLKVQTTTVSPKTRPFQFAFG